MSALLCLHDRDRSHRPIPSNGPPARGTETLGTACRLGHGKINGHQAAADAPGTLRAYKADLENFKAWCISHAFEPMPAAPETVGAYLAAAGLGNALPTLRRRVAAIARAHRIDKHPLDTKHPAIRETHRGIARMHGEPARRSAALTTSDIKRLVEVCGDDLAGQRDRAVVPLGFAGALRRSELVGIDVEHVRSAQGGLRLLIPRSKTNAAGEGAEIGIMRGAQPETCPVRALRAWLRAAKVTEGPVFRRVTQWTTVGTKRLHPDAVRQILLKRAATAGVKGTMLEPVTPHGMRAGFVTTAYRNGVSDEEIMGHTRHRGLTTMRSYVRRAKLGGASPSGNLDL
jgi:integrase